MKHFQAVSKPGGKRRLLDQVEMGKVEMSEFLTHLAVDGHVAASTQNQALAALLVRYCGQQCNR